MALLRFPLVATVFLALLLQACALPPRADDRAQLVAKLTMQAELWDKAIVRKDRAAIEANMADDFRQIDSRGNVETKGSFVEDLMSPDLQIEPYAVEDFDVRVYDNVALLSGRTRMNGSFQGKPFSIHYRYIDIYVRHGGQWKIVSVQVSPLPK
jgi:ketosteroid isomerase-like protein